MKLRSYQWMVLLLLSFFLLTGCLPNSAGKPGSGGDAPPAQKPAEPAKPPVTEAVAPAKIYFGTHDARYLVAEVHLLKPGPKLLQQALEALIAGPKNKDLVAVLPRATKVRSVQILDRTAYADFSPELVKRGFGGSATEILAVAAIVNTLTEFPDIERVQILVEGKKVSTLYGHVDIFDPLNRSPAIIRGK